MVTTILNILLYAVKNWPSFKEAIDSIVSEYTKSQYTKMQKDIQTAIAKAVLSHDQRPIETAIGSTTAGEISDVPESTVVDFPPPRS